MTKHEYPRQLRLLTAGDFKYVFDDASVKAHDQRVLILARPNGLDHPRIGFVISKKNIRRAVKRNLVRRIIRESFRLNQHKLPALDMVVLARPGLGDLSTEDIHALSIKSWNKLIQKANNAHNKQVKRS
ncbi:ribonuclease P protein component [Neptunomonas phycophila]|jgi:ribonuclease P protein component|uniref:ribonuclease P protein component n=1 Tax=Neptunomonas phycophila TaxID=1572645 RepID=UPI0015C0E83C|nr:ribonuclease P protein component [Neptunomonas phycophila]MDO6784433.1 ribonuclease P protein component [Neptunomonas phycophila]QLE99358.1 ribonuclease P protein component [Neptunomonas phycophila]